MWTAKPNLTLNGLGRNKMRAWPFHHGPFVGKQATVGLTKAIGSVVTIFRFASLIHQFVRRAAFRPRRRMFTSFFSTRTGLLAGEMLLGCSGGFLFF